MSFESILYLKENIITDNEEMPKYFNYSNLIEARIKKSNEDNRLLYEKIQELKFKANTGRRYKINRNVQFKILEEWGFY